MTASEAPLDALMRRLRPLGRREYELTAAEEPSDPTIQALCGADNHVLRGLVTPKGEFRTDVHRVAASVLFYHYAFRVVPPVFAGYVLAKRVPDVHGANVVPRFAPGCEVERITLRRPVIATLRCDPLAEHANMFELPDDAALLAWTVGRLMDHNLIPLMDRLRREGTPSPRLQHGNIAAAIAFAAGHLYVHLGGLEERVTEARHFLDACVPSVGDDIAFFGVDVGDGLALGTRRGTCCLWYLASFKLEDYCANCPILDECERSKRLGGRVVPLAAEHPA